MPWWCKWTEPKGFKRVKAALALHECETYMRQRRDGYETRLQARVDTIVTGEHENEFAM